MSLQEKVDHAYFTRKMFMGAVLPAPLAGIGLALAEMGHTILVGHAIGTEGLAAVGFVSPLFLLAAFFVFGLLTPGAGICRKFTRTWAAVSSRGSLGIETPLGASPEQTAKVCRGEVKNRAAWWTFAWRSEKPGGVVGLSYGEA